MKKSSKSQAFSETGPADCAKRLQFNLNDLAAPESTNVPAAMLRTSIYIYDPNMRMCVVGAYVEVFRVV